ncbi:MAG: DUF3108 domain-containing protein [Acidobacteriales bacterium]|nr:DUF3108 domain-containing protein [Terriglobales bacterium]
MSLTRNLLLLLTFMLSAAGAQTVPAFDGEKLIYNVNWPSGLSLGEAHMNASRIAGQDTAPGWQFEFQLDAAIPGFAVTDYYRSVASADLCSIEFEKNAAHGKRKAREKTVFNQQTGMATRQTIGGGKSELPVGVCGRDALAFLYHVRRELAQGRLPAPQRVLSGAAYQISMQYLGAQMVRTGDSQVEADRLSITGKGPASAFSFEALFARDATRTPVLIKVPLAMGAFSMELVR